MVILHDSGFHKSFARNHRRLVQSALLTASTKTSAASAIYCEKFLEFLSDLVSQLPTRRYVNTLLLDLNILAVIRLSPVFNREENGLLRDLFLLLRHFMNFPIDDSTGAQLTHAQSLEKHCEQLACLQRTALKLFKPKLTILALSNYGSLGQRKELESHFRPLAESELAELCASLGFRTTYPPAANVLVGSDLQLEVLISAHERRKSFQETIRDLSTVPTEAALYESSLIRNEIYDGSRSLAVPKLNLQYLSVGDFLCRAFILYRCESFFEIRKHIEDVLKRLQPKVAGSAGGVKFEGFSKMAIPISKPA